MQQGDSTFPACRGSGLCRPIPKALVTAGPADSASPGGGHKKLERKRETACPAVLLRLCTASKLWHAVEPAPNAAGCDRRPKGH